MEAAVHTNLKVAEVVVHERNVRVRSEDREIEDPVVVVVEVEPPPLFVPPPPLLLPPPLFESSSSSSSDSDSEEEPVPPPPPDEETHSVGRATVIVPQEECSDRDPLLYEPIAQTKV